MIKESRTITDPDHPEQPLDIELQALDEARRHLMVDVCQDLIENYMGSPGDPAKGVEPTRPKRILPTVRIAGKSERIVVSRNLCMSVARILTQQTGVDDTDRLTPEQLFISTRTWAKGWRELTEWSADLQNRADKRFEEQESPLGNDSLADTVDS